MTYPIDFGKTFNIVAINSDYKKWEGPWVQKAYYENIAREFQGWGENVQKILKLLDNDDAAAWYVVISLSESVVPFL